MIINELKTMKDSIYNDSSHKEQAFYQFLVGESENGYTDRSSYLEPIYSIILMTDNPITKELIEKHRETQPIGGFHYSTNLIELVAMAMDDIEQERDNLQIYCQDHSTKDFYIINSLFPNVIPYPPEPQGSIDQIAKHLYEGSFPSDNWRSLILKALYETSDLVDFYIVEKGVEKALDDSPIVHKVDDILQVRNVCFRFVQITESIVKFTIWIVYVLIVCYVLVWLIPNIIKYWDQLEPLIFIFQIIFFIINIPFLFSRFFPFKKNRFFSFLREKVFSSLREKVFNWVFSIFGIARMNLKESLNHLKCKDNE